MITVQYVGKKAPFTFINPNIKSKMAFVKPGDRVEITKPEYEWIMKFNPTGFVQKVEPEREHQARVVEAVEEAVEEKEAPAEELRCPHCFKPYTDKMWYDKHVAKCKGDIEDEHSNPEEAD
jgi:hypothetical protein